MKIVKVLLMTILFTLGLGTMALAAGPNPDCPDADHDGICNGKDPDYVPGRGCRADCPDADGDGICNGQDPDYVPGSCTNPDCPDADGDGICNCQDPDYTPPDNGLRRYRHHRNGFRGLRIWM